MLSLGTVGYGIALIYVLFGAPDLAMTQFAVETLTVVIFVLVFYQLNGFGDLSSPLVKVRDAVIAAAAGTIIAVAGALHRRLRHDVAAGAVLRRRTPRRWGTDATS